MDLQRDVVSKDAEALRDSEERYRFLSETIPVQIWTAAINGQLTYVSNQTAIVLGVTPAQLLEDGWQNVVHADDLGLAIERWTHALATGEKYQVEFRLKAAGGEYLWHLAQAVAQRDASGAIVRWFGTNTNIEEQRAHRREVESLVEQLKEMVAERSRLAATAEDARLKADLANRAKDEFLATASHELRTPLNAILGWVRLLRSGTVEPGDFARGLEVIERNGHAQVQLIEDILDGSRIITGNLHLEIRSIELLNIVQAAIDTVRPAALARNITLVVALDPSASRMRGDPDRLQQVVWNLVNNALKFTPKGGRVEVRLDRVGTAIELVVQDSGQGIEANFLPHVFERFRQADASTTRRHGGLGLGLALVRHLVEAHGGSVRAESAGVGLGATFTVSLPVQAVFPETTNSDRAPANGAFPKPLLRHSLRGISVLVTDDELDARELLATLLRAHGAEVRLAGSAQQAIDLLEQDVPTLLISDIGMPIEDGHALIRRVRALAGDAGRVPAIALTAYAREEDRRRALEAGFNTYLAKPVDPESLVRVVGQFGSVAQAK